MDPTNRLMNSGANFAVKTCTGPYIDKSAAEIINAQNLRRSYYNSVGKIGDLEVLNDIAGPIAQGLRTMTHASNSIRSGCGSIPTIIGQVLDGGLDWVLSQMSIPSTVVQMLEQFHPEVANNAYANAKMIYEKVSTGTFKMTDVPVYLQEFQNLERLIRGIYTPFSSTRELRQRCDASPYAIDLLARAPKYKFLFVVQFIAAPGFSEMDSVFNDTAFMIKKTSRPRVKFTGEDINYYNFKTHVITKTEFEEMTMSFHDDNGDKVHEFYKTCMNNLIPITKNKQWVHPDILETSGMNFNITNQGYGPNYAASLGPVLNDNKQTLFKEIVLYHVYDWGHNVNTYRFVNPKITSLSPDDLDMSDSTSLAELSLTFKFDYVIVTTEPMKDIKFDETQRGALYPLRFNGSDATDGPNMSSKIRPYNASGTSAANACNPLKALDTTSVGTKQEPFKTYPYPPSNLQGETISSGTGITYGSPEQPFNTYPYPPSTLTSEQFAKGDGITHG